MRNQDDLQGRHFGFSSETNRDRFLDVHSGSARGRQRARTPRLQKGRQVLKDMEHFPLPEAAQSNEPSQMAAQPSLAHSWTGLVSNWNKKQGNKGDKKRQGKCPILLLVPSAARHSIP